MTSPATLDIDAIRAFLLIAELQSFTRAAEVIDSTQAAVSLKLQKLERGLGRRLVERTPRRVRLSADGAAFLDAARELLQSHERALAAFGVEERRLVVGISQFLIGVNPPRLLKRLGAAHPTIAVAYRVGGSRELLAAFDEGRLDAAIVLHSDDRRRKGERLFPERFGWFATPEFRVPPGRPLPLATQGKTCRIRMLAVQALDEAGIAWTEVLVANGAATLGAAALGGLGIAVLTCRAAPDGTVDIGKRLSLPAAPQSDVVLYSNVTDVRSRAALTTLASAFRNPGSA